MSGQCNFQDENCVEPPKSAMGKLRVVLKQALTSSAANDNRSDEEDSVVSDQRVLAVTRIHHAVMQFRRKCYSFGHYRLCDLVYYLH